MTKQIKDLPANSSLDGTELFEIQKGTGIGSSQKGLLSAITTYVGGAIASLFASAAQGAKADTAVQSVVAQTYTTVDSSDPINPKVGVSAQVAKKDQTQQYSKAQTVSPVVNATVTGTITPDCSATNTFEYTLTGNTIIANPTGTSSGQYISILIAIGATSYTCVLGANFKVMNATSTKTDSNTVNLLSGYVASDGNIYCSISQ